MKTFFLKLKHFFKRNIYPITVTVCTALVLGIIAISAYSAIRSSNEESVNTNVPVQSGQNTGSEDLDDDDKQTSGSALIFDLPFEGAKVSKEYTETSLLYDATTGFWCTHQALDFACGEGQQVVAVYGGTISKIENTMMNGTVVYLKVADDLTVVYKGLSSDVSVSEGQNVSKGQLLGKVTMMLSEKKDGHHLHLELTKADKLIDPTEYFSFNK